MTEEEIITMITEALQALIRGGTEAARDVLSNSLNDDLQDMAFNLEVLALLCREITERPPPRLLAWDIQEN